MRKIHNKSIQRHSSIKDYDIPGLAPLKSPRSFFNCFALPGKYSKSRSKNPPAALSIPACDLRWHGY